MRDPLHEHGWSPGGRATTPGGLEHVPDVSALTPVPRAVLGRRARVLLWALRIVVLLLAVMVVGVFIVQLGG